MSFVPNNAVHKLTPFYQYQCHVPFTPNVMCLFVIIFKTSLIRFIQYNKAFLTYMYGLIKHFLAN